jgi:hypothetical protein
VATVPRGLTYPNTSSRLHTKQLIPLENISDENKRHAWKQIRHDISKKYYCFEGLAIQGCQIFLGTTYQNGEKCTKLPKYTKWTQNIPNGHKIYLMAVK